MNELFSPDGLALQVLFGNAQKYEACFTENDVTYDRSQFPNIKNWDIL